VEGVFGIVFYGLWKAVCARPELSSIFVNVIWWEIIEKMGDIGIEIFLEDKKSGSYCTWKVSLAIWMQVWWVGFLRYSTYFLIISS